MDIEQLIREVHARPEVWNQKSINYYNRDIVAKKWIEIAKACDMPSEAVRCKWKHLRDHFRKEFKKNMETKDKDQSEKYESQWVWYKNLWFLGDQLMTKKITQHQPLFGALIKDRKSMNDENSKEDSEENRAACSQDDHLTTSTFEDDLNHSLQDDSSMESKGKLLSAHFAECETGRRRKKTKYFNDISHQNSDDTYHFLMSLMTPLKYLPYDRQMLVRLKIQSIVTDEVAKLQNDDILYPVELKANYSDENSSPLSPDVVISDMSCDNENLYK